MGQPTPLGIQEPVISDELRARTSLGRIDYADAFTLARGRADRTPQDWGQMMFVDILGRGAQVVWRVLMGLKLHNAPDRLAGWEIGARGDGWVRMDAAGRGFAVELIVEADDAHATLATFIRYDGRYARMSWPHMSKTHRGAAPGLLRDAHDRLA